MNIKWNPDYEVHEQVHENGYIEVMQVNTEKCEWVHEASWDRDFYDTSCDNGHEFIVGGVKDNFYKYCPYCGKVIEVKK